MKTFEEQYTAWLEGALAPAEQAQFERECGPEIEAEQAAATKLGDLLRRHASAPRLTNGDFFNHQLLERMEREQARPAERQAGWSWPRLFPHLAWGGVCSLLVSALIFNAWVQPSQREIAARAPKRAAGTRVAVAPRPARPVAGGEVSPAAFQETVVEAKGLEPGVSATPVRGSREGLPIVWLDGLDYLPATYTLQ